MNNLFLRGSIVLCIGVGGVFLTGCQNDKGDENKRDIEISGKYPWEAEQPKTLEQYIKHGEVVYLFSDGEALEEKIKNLALEDKESKERYTKSWSIYLDQYISQVEKNYPEKSEYFTKLKEVKTDLDEKKYDKIPEKLKVAKKLREE